MAVEFVDPRAEPLTPVEPYQLALDPGDGAIGIGLLANGFPDSVAFLDQVEQVLATHYPRATFHRYDKGNASAVASDQLLDGITKECKAVVAAYGH